MDLVQNPPWNPYFGKVHLDIEETWITVNTFPRFGALTAAVPGTSDCLALTSRRPCGWQATQSCLRRRSSCRPTFLVGWE